jgi:hypothetical protein
MSFGIQKEGDVSKNGIYLRPQLKGREGIQWLALLLSDGLGAVSKLRCLFTVFPPQWPWLDPRLCEIYCGQVAVGQVSSPSTSVPPTVSH